MTNDERKTDSGIISAGNSQALTRRTSSLAARGLHTASNWDANTLIEAAKAITSSPYWDDVLRTATGKINEILRPEIWSLLITDHEKQELYFEIAIGKDAETLKDVRIKLGQGIAGWVAQTGESAIIRDTSEDSRFFSNVGTETRTEIRSFLAVPVRFRDENLGVIEWVNYADSAGFSETDIFSLQTLADFLGVALAHARHVMRIHELIIIDAQTGLYNSRHLDFILDTEVDRSERYKYEFSMVGIDAGLKHLSSSLSHDAFLRLLAEIGRHLKVACRLIDFAFRYGDEEFVVVLPQTCNDKANAIAARIPKLLDEPLRSATNRQPKCAVASVTYPRHGKTRSELLGNLDDALYQAKTRLT